ncbi:MULTISPECIES: 5-formyltetrahydrofolate cyclo-ligase [unclassified Arcicella]|uniref:5-formyltetrahydrofolate cyclo-ligase n=1 Tax=unclassified Arcicella TaxID=2644986 RepID=UPI00285822ED|nr:MULTISPECIES: 5-formyltetrahydrofolate cyclo-ligase [unclassified Arcicella]MDR6564869.1 5-formyltetrahydrofolate cyclo-ligase [Arcicella sp. BE51]MDR6814636.1 5-formyltetrahydrofolate cyclo-ligase [Arcicella sp. BE140]MDR6826082.1 5-formyltetrahydrofolate cyclo-ligase [Arcicella sp. BE139]
MNKSALRKHYLAQRKALGQESITEKSQAICDLFFQHFNLSTIEYLHIFLPIIRHHEINTFLIIDRIQQEFPHVQLVVPKSIPETNEMEHFLYDKSQLVENKWGIPEPIPTIPVLPIDISMVIVPLLIFDIAGNRVGYGKGFYDRFLKQCAPDLITIGLCLEEPIDNIEDVNEFDVKINYCISPNRLYSFG